MNIKELGENLFAAAAVTATTLLSPVLRRWYNRWGVSAEEARRTLPGDTRVPKPRLEYTRAINIHAPTETVWGYVVQIGQERGGMYSYEGLENLIGCRMRNADRIVPDWQNPKVGDKVRLGPKGYPLYEIVEIESKHALVVMGADPVTEKAPERSEPMPERYNNTVWALVVEPISDTVTRLFTRTRMDYSPQISNDILWRFFEPINFVMERKMLLSIKQFAERDTVKAIS
jgi:hypothetical protein